MYLGLNLKGGLISSNTKIIDLSIGLNRQTDILIEDICQIEYPNNTVIDISWLGEERAVNADSFFLIQIVKNHDWDEPFLAIKTLPDPIELRNSLKRFIEIVVKNNSLRKRIAR